MSAKAGDRRVGSSAFEVIRTRLVVEEVRHDSGPPNPVPQRRAAAAAVVRNPFRGRYVHDLLGGPPGLADIGRALAHQLVEALGGAEAVEGYGKGAIVGADGELEHGALWHVPGGYAMRDALPSALAIVPSTKKIGAPGCRIDIPITHKDASYVRSHFDAIEVRVPGAPARDEIVLILAMTTGPRVHARVGGLSADEIQQRDGLR